MDQELIVKGTVLYCTSVPTILQSTLLLEPEVDRHHVVLVAGPQTAGSVCGMTQAALQDSGATGG